MRMTAGLFIFSLLFTLFTLTAQAENTTFDLALPEAESQGPSSNNFVNSFQNDLGSATSKSYESSTSYQTAPAAVPPVAEEVKGGYESAFSSYHSKKSSDDEGEVAADDWRKGQEKQDGLDLDNMTYNAPVKNTVQSAKSRAPTSVPEDDVVPASAKARKTMVMKTISDNYDELKTCYHDGLKNSSEMKGKVVMGWNMDTQGRVSGVEVLVSQLNNKQVEKCMKDRLASWSFPRQAKLKGSKDRMTYTFQFVTEKE